MFLKYVSVGVLNTFLTLFVIMLFYYVFETNYLSAYTAGYFSGYVSSLVLNKIYTFKNRETRFDTHYVTKFTIYFIIAFFASKAILYYSVEMLNFDETLSLFAGMISYTLISYVLFEKFVYKK